jgi:hypothetical protein
MFCSECGVKASGKFCWSCGQSLKQEGSQSIAHGEQADVAPPADWTESLDCQAIIAIPHIRQRIANCAARAKKKFSGEDFLECCDQVLGPITGGVPLSLIAKIAQPINQKLGLKTGKNRSERLTERPGTVLVAVLCSLAQNGQKILDVSQSPNSCTLRIAIPSDIWSMKSDLLITIRAEHPATLVEASLTIPGQVYDWGKCNRVLDRLFADAVQLAKAA